jgi:cyclophilin family peptidyl-prolyl cis-trans isomerase
MLYLRITTLAAFLAVATMTGCDSYAPETDVVIMTEEGDIEIDLFDDTPKHRENFIKLVNEGFYDGQAFHRIIKGFMIQGGDPFSRDSAANADSIGTGGPGYTLPAEFVPNRYHFRGALSAARQGDEGFVGVAVFYCNRRFGKRTNA